MTKAVIFDLNGVLLLRKMLSDAMEEKYGISSQEFIGALKEIMPIVRKPNAPEMFELWKPFFLKWNVAITKEEFFSFWFSQERLNEELLAYLQELKKKDVKLFILSNNFRERTMYYRAHFPDLFVFFDKVYFSWETGYLKSTPEAYRNVLEENNLKAEECLYFDDSKKNVLLAKEVGIDAELYTDNKAVKEKINAFVKISG